MDRLSRRQFIVGGSCIGAGLTLSRGSRAAPDITPSDGLPSELLPGVNQRRAAILAAMAKHAVPAAAVALIHRGKVAWTEGFGVTDRVSGNAVDTRTLFSIQSTSKNFTATAIMLAVQKRILDLDRPITAYLPEFKVQSRFEEAPQREMTLRLLLSHRAGFTHEAPIGNNNYPAFPSFEAHIRSISDTWLRYPVGERYSYSNLGFDLAGYILQKASGVPFDEFVRATVFDPLGMADSTFSSKVYTTRENRAVGHKPGYDTVPLVTPLIPSGGVYTSAKDMATYALFHLNKGMVSGTQILDTKLWEEMHTLQFDGHYCLGVTRDKVKYGETLLSVLNHNGGGFGFGSIFTFYPEADLAWVALFNNGDAPYDEFGEALPQDLLQRQYGEPASVLAAKGLYAVDIPRKVLESYVGGYVARGDRFVDFNFKDGRFAMQDGGRFYEVTFISPENAFITGALNAHFLRFDPAQRGETARVEWSDGPSDLDYNDGPHDVAGPNKKEWVKYLGDYQVMRWGKPSGKMTVHTKNGYLYIDNLRLVVELRRGLFFAANGEALDFRDKLPTFGNIPTEKVQGGNPVIA
jgi:CubicO group peptidase (beta-lactamase class C family)